MVEARSVINNAKKTEGLGASTFFGKILSDHRQDGNDEVHRL